MTLLITLLTQSMFTYASPSKNILWDADMRLRQEWISQEKANPASGTYSKLQFRVGGLSEVSETTKLQFRLATGTGRTSTNQTLGDSNSAWRNMGIALDRAFFDTHPFSNHLFIKGGRVPNPYFLPGGSDLVWDSDLNFDGAAFQFNHTLGQNIETSWVESFFWVDKAGTNREHDVYLVGFQGKVGQKTDLSWNASLGYFTYSHVAGHEPFNGTTSNFQGNSSAGAGPGYRYDFRVWQLGAEVEPKPIQGLQFLFFGDLAINGDPESGNRAYLIGAKLGKLSKKGDWQAAYDFRNLGQDSVIGAFTDADSLGGGTHGTSHRLKFAYQLDENWSAAITRIMGNINTATDHSLERSKLMLDLMLRL